MLKGTGVGQESAARVNAFRQSARDAASSTANYLTQDNLSSALHRDASRATSETGDYLSRVFVEGDLTATSSWSGGMFDVAAGGIVTRSARAGRVADSGSGNTRLVSESQSGPGVEDGVAGTAARRTYLNEKFGRTGDIHTDINIRQRKAISRDFYEGVGFSGRRLENHLKGIDYTKDVDFYTLSSGRPVSQWQPSSSEVGNYFSRIGGNPNKMGIDVDGRELLIYAPTQRATVLRSTAADIPSWKGDDQIYRGGEVQYFTGDQSVFRLLDEGF